MSGHVSWLDPQKVRKMVVVGSEKMLVYDDIDSQRHVQIYDKSVAIEFQFGTQDYCDFRTRTRAGDLAVPQIGLIEPLGVEIAHFAECVRDRLTPRTGGVHGLRVISVMEAMSKSMREDGLNVRDAVRHGLAEAGVETGIHYPIPVHEQPAYTHLVEAPEALPETHRLCPRILSLPIYPTLTREQVEVVSHAVRAAVSST